MAGQPPDVPWQSPSPNGQPGQEQVRVAWQPPQPPQAQQQPYDRGQPFEQGQPFDQGQAYGQGRPYQQQPYAQPGGYVDPVADQHTQAWGPGAPQAGAPQAGWPPPPPGNPAFVARQRHVSHEKGFVASLFDFGFNSYVTPKVIKGLYTLATLWTILVAVFLLLVILHIGKVNAGTIIFCLISIPTFVLLSLGSIRVLLELPMALHRINENMQALRDRDEAN